jgi:hypothetical protein
VRLMDDWVAGGRYPTQPAVAAAFDGPNGYEPLLTPGAWPAPEAAEAESAG